MAFGFWVISVGWTLIEADVVNGRSLTAWPSLQTDLKNAGKWVDQEVVVDNGLVTSRKSQDIPAFNRAIVAAFAASHQQDQPLSTVR